MITIILTVLYIAACCKWGAWRRWKEFYPTILYVILANLTYAFVFYDYRLWVFSSFMGDSMTCLIIKDIIYPPAVILFLTHYPSGVFKQAVYILVWAAVNTAFEYLAYLFGGIYYNHGWNLFFSFILLIIAFILMRIHYKKPLLVWIPSVALGIAVALIFSLPYPR